MNLGRARKLGGQGSEPLMCMVAEHTWTGEEVSRELAGLTWFLLVSLIRALATLAPNLTEAFCPLRVLCRRQRPEAPELRVQRARRQATDR